MDWFSLAIGLVMGWVSGVLVGHCLRLEDQYNNVLQLLKTHISLHNSRTPRFTLTEEDADSEWEEWENN